MTILTHAAALVTGIIAGIALCVLLSRSAVEEIERFSDFHGDAPTPEARHDHA